MVLADKSDAGKKSRASSPNNGQRSESSSDEREGGGGMRVGRDYQAAVPPLIPVLDRKSEQYADRALLVWSPNNDIPEAKLEEYITVSKEKYGYNTEQALGMLFWHKHDLEKAVTDLSNFTPFPDEWTVEDKVLFEQAFQFHGKSFHRIRQMLPDKTIAALVRYYYSWKKIRVRSSLMDKQIRRIAQKGLDEVLGEEGNEAASSPRSESVDAKAETKDGEVRSACTNCGISCLSLQSTNKGNLCGTCAQHFKKTGLLRPTLGPIRPKDKVNAHSLHSSINRHKRGPPKGMYLEHDALLMIATGDQGQGEAILKDMDGEVVALKRMVQSNKQLISALKRRTTQGLWAGLGPNVPVPKLDTTPKINARWTNEELLLAVQGVRKFGKDLKAIAEVLGTKSEAHVRSFFVTYQKRYNLKAVLAEYYAETGMPMPPITDDEKMEIDLGSSGSEASTPIATTPGRVSPVAPSAVPVPPQPLVTPIKLNPNSKLTSTASPSAQTQAVK